jgi:hypothetical protein
MGSRRTLPMAPGGGGGLRAHGGAHVDAGAPVEGLVDERHGGGAAAAEDDALMGTPSGFSQAGSIDGHCERGAVKRPLGCAALAPVPLPISGVQRRPPVQAFGGRLVGHALPPHAAVGRERDIGKDGVAGQRGHGVGIGLVAGARRDAEESRLGIDGAQLAVWRRA